MIDEYIIIYKVVTWLLTHSDWPDLPQNSVMTMQSVQNDISHYLSSTRSSTLLQSSFLPLLLTLLSIFVQLANFSELHSRLGLDRPVERGERGGGSFPGLHDVWGARQCGRHRSKILKKVFQTAFFLTSNMHKIHFRPGTPLGSLWCSPDL